MDRAAREMRRRGDRRPRPANRDAWAAGRGLESSGQYGRVRQQPLPKKEERGHTLGLEQARAATRRSQRSQAIRAPGRQRPRSEERIAANCYSRVQQDLRATQVNTPPKPHRPQTQRRRPPGWQRPHRRKPQRGEEPERGGKQGGARRDGPLPRLRGPLYSTANRGPPRNNGAEEGPLPGSPRPKRRAPMRDGLQPESQKPKAREAGKGTRQPGGQTEAAPRSAQRCKQGLNRTTPAATAGRNHATRRGRELQPRRGTGRQLSARRRETGSSGVISTIRAPTQPRPPSRSLIQIRPQHQAVRYCRPAAGHPWHNESRWWQGAGHCTFCYHGAGGRLGSIAGGKHLLCD